MLLITGATGYVGTHLVARLVAQGERPRCLVRDWSEPGIYCLLIPLSWWRVTRPRWARLRLLCRVLRLLCMQLL